MIENSNSGLLDDVHTYIYMQPSLYSEILEKLTGAYIFEEKFIKYAKIFCNSF